MSGYSSQNFKQRYGILGDLAEDAFTRWAIVNDHKFVQRGWDRPPLNRFFKINHIDRSTPDFVLETPTDHFYVDCKGTGDPNHVKIKQESLDGLHWWNSQHPVYFFVWNSKIKKHVFLKYDEVVIKVTELEKKHFPNDSKLYYEMPVNFDSGVVSL